MLKAAQLLLLCAWTVVLTPFLWAQEGQAPGAQDQAATPAEEKPASTSTLIPDTRHPSGVEELRAESPGGSRNYVIPSLRLSAFGDSNRTILTTGQQGVELTGSAVAGLDIHHFSRKNDFALNYQGGGVFYVRDSDLNAMMHQLAFSERYVGRRWGITLGDQFSYLPESAFGFGGFGPSFSLGGSAGGWAPPFNPGQSLYSGGGQRFVNAALSQVEYNASARTSFTFAGSYGVLRFKDPGFVESNSLFASTGYNHAITRRDTISLSYGFGAIRYLSPDVNLDNHFLSIGYSRHLTGKLAFTISGGPQLIIRRSPAFATETITDFFAHTTMDYKVGRTNLNWSYAHYTSNGSGVFLGATTDYVDGSLSHQLTRNWSWSVGPGYSRNAQLRAGSGSTNNSVFNSIYGQTSLNRNLGRYTDLSLSYNVYTQWFDSTGTAGTTHTSSYLRHFFGVSVTWHGSRIGLD